MNILFICDEYPSLPHGGIGTVTPIIAEGMIGLGHDLKNYRYHLFKYRTCN